jgi:hypothetical protein
MPGAMFPTVNTADDHPGTLSINFSAMRTWTIPAAIFPPK